MIFCRNKKRNSRGFFRITVLALLVVIMMLGLTGCRKASASLETALTLTDSGSGTRVMKLTISKSDYKKAFSGVNLDSLGSKITESCPAGMEFSYSDDGKQYVFTFSVPFQDIAGYESVTAAITGEKTGISHEEPESVFTTGLRYEENFSTLDLIGWVAGPFSEVTEGKTTLSGLLEPDNWVVSYGDTSYSGQAGPIVIDTLVETPVERIDILTLLKQNQTCTRQVIFTFTQENLNKNEKQIKKYLQAAVPETSVSGWEQSGQKALFSVSGADMTAEDLDAFMKNLFGSENCRIKDRESGDSYLFDADVSRSETIDLSAFLYETCPKIALGYYVQYENGMDVSITMKDAKEAQKLKKSETYGGYYMAFEKTVSKATFTTDIEADYYIDTIDVSTVFHKNDNVTREISLVFLQNPSASHLETMRKKIAEKAEAYAEVSAQTEREDKKTAIVITQTGSMSFLNEGFMAIFGVNGQITHKSSGKLLSFNHTGTFSDVLDFTKFIKNEGYLTTLNYSLTLLSGERITVNTISSSISLNEGTESAKGNKYSGSLTGGIISITMNTEVWNSDAVMLFVLILGMILAVIFILFCAKGISMFFGKDAQSVEEGEGRLGKPVKLDQVVSGIREKLPKGGFRKQKSGMDEDFDEDEAFEEEKSKGKQRRRTFGFGKGFVTEETVVFSDDDDFADDITNVKEYKDEPKESADPFQEESDFAATGFSPADVMVDDKEDFYGEEDGTDHFGSKDGRQEAGPFTNRMNADREKREGGKGFRAEDNIQRINNTILEFMFDDEEDEEE